MGRAVDPTWLDDLRLWRRWSAGFQVLLEARGGWRKWGGLGPQLSSRALSQRSNQGTRGGMGGVGPRTARCCCVSSFGLAMGGMTWRAVIKAAVLMGSRSRPSWFVAQTGLSEWSFRCAHLESGGFRDCRPRRWRGMSNFTASLGLLKRPGCGRTRPRSVGLKDNLGGDGGRLGDSSRIPWRLQAWAFGGEGRRRPKWTCTTDHPTTWAGSLWGRRGDLRWTFGDHSAAWGQGLAIPRGRTLACGRPGIAGTRPVGHHGLMRGGSGDARLGRPWDPVMWRHWPGPNKTQTWFWMSTSQAGCFGGVRGGHVQGAWPWFGQIGRAWGDAWLLQATGRGRWVFHEPDASHFATLYSMACRPRQGCALSDEVGCGQQNGHAGSAQAWVAFGLHRRGG